MKADVKLSVCHLKQHQEVYLGVVFSHSVVVEAGLRPELFVTLLALQGILELQRWKTKHVIKCSLYVEEN